MIKTLILLIIIPIAIIATYYTLTINIWKIIYYLKGIRRIKGKIKYMQHENIFKKLFYDLPKQVAYDIMTRNPYEFREYGFHLITGKQGTGKTITVAYLLQKYKEIYPKLKIKTNMSYNNEDEKILNWKDITNSENGIYGEIDVLDEVQNWFSSNESKNFPPEMLREVTQQRKQRKMIIGTSQVFTRVSKSIRENVYIVYEPITFFNCLTIVRSYEPELDENGIVKKKKPRKTFCFVHNKKLRESYDTYKKIEEMSKIGYKEINDLK